MKRYTSIIVLFLLINNVQGWGKIITGGYVEKSKTEIRQTEQNLIRAMEIADKAFESYFSGDNMKLARFYNPYTGEHSKETGSIWMYTSAIEAVNAILNGLAHNRSTVEGVLYEKHYERYVDMLDRLYKNADFYLGTFSLVSYTQTREWSVYGVHRASSTGSAKVEGIENVYDDQMWLIRELLESYHITQNERYLEKAEYLTEYVLDGWDCTRDADGEERGGIPWGPGYVSKHSCSNGPMISPLVWLHEHYKYKEDELTHRYIDSADKETRRTKQVKKSDYYLEFAMKVYDWQKQNLLRTDGLYDDMMGGCSPRKPETESINGETYRKGILCKDRVGPAYTYNSGTMLSGAADLLRVTSDERYFEDASRLAEASFKYFAKLDAEVTGYYSYDVNGFRNWFNGVLLRGYVDLASSGRNVSEYVNSFQNNLDYGYENFLHEGILPTNLLTGWNSDPNKNNTEAMFSFAFAAQYANLSLYERKKD